MRDITLDLQPINVLTGSNGCGKSNLLQLAGVDWPSRGGRTRARGCGRRWNSQRLLGGRRARAPMRLPQIGVQTPVLSRNGEGLAAALQTILEIGDESGLRQTIAEAFGGATLTIEAMDTMFRTRLNVPGLLRPLHASEFSDGQLRFLCLCAALLSPRPPSLLALNEPETSLHPDLIGSLARLIVRASSHTQLWITTHSRVLADQIEKHSGLPRTELYMSGGETRVRSMVSSPDR